MELIKSTTLTKAFADVGWAFRDLNKRKKLLQNAERDMQDSVDAVFAARQSLAKAQALLSSRRQYVLSMDNAVESAEKELARLAKLAEVMQREADKKPDGE